MFAVGILDRRGRKTPWRKEGPVENMSEVLTAAGSPSEERSGQDRVIRGNSYKHNSR